MSWDSDFTVVKASENISEPRGKPFSLYIHTLDSETNAKSTDRSIFGYHPSTWETVSALLFWDFLKSNQDHYFNYSFPWEKIITYTCTGIYKLAVSLKSIIFHLNVLKTCYPYNFMGYVYMDSFVMTCRWVCN